MWIDSHCHPHLLNFENKQNDDNNSNSQLQNQHLAIKRALDLGIKMLCVAVDIKDYEVLKSFNQTFPDSTWIGLGQHPLHEEMNEQDWHNLARLVKEDKNIIAVGETGFDFQGDLKKQRKAFEQHVEIACENNLPIILHTREMEAETKKAIIDAKKHFPNLKGVFHCFTGSIDLAEFAIEMEWMISFSGIITFKSANNLREVATHLYKNNWLDNVLIETDCPYLAPMPMRGKQNEPGYVQYVGEFLAQFFQKGIKEFAVLIENNFNKLFLNK